MINYNKLGAIIGLTVIGMGVLLTNRSEGLVGAIIGFIGGVLVTNGVSK